jgi:CDP-diglyceride synthetase
MNTLLKRGVVTAGLLSVSYYATISEIFALILTNIMMVGVVIEFTHISHSKCGLVLFGLWWFPLYIAQYYTSYLEYYTVIVACNMFDIFQFLCGSAFGTIKCFKSISPNKTVEGYVGGYLMSCVIFPYFKLDLFMFIPMYILGVCGDLFASYIKRYLNIKDFSQFLGPHGGLMDRMDSIAFAVPFYVFFQQTETPYFYKEDST